MRFCGFVLTIALVASTALAQSPGNSGPGANQAPPSYANQNDDSNVSSSRDNQIDISPPKNDAKDHPNSGMPDLSQPDLSQPDLSQPGLARPTPPSSSSSTSGARSDVNEVHLYNPYRADKDLEVGEYYLKLKDYKGALARFQDALIYKPNDAMANLRMAECYEKINDPTQAAVHYREYLRILPNGPESKRARKALEKLPSVNTAEK
jgi:tetratricopeptide (TPR) repeat protein